ncbi:hypothetical protein PGUG_03734 [Meyerozyma guilliermondii ATCC 6260]|uniref:Inorganic phosphate transporter PHO86 n=1 Tax=Meyerozyma guilliermondii (strain ATCC 6260 / CBS 566 / DSM 6381 / JCM 1539 / NBRC 10279 / NRRL Y-324) TaxID=294746 RepID=A5DKD3_PICGU|nr:uncharacterized protein PGUG_03734 [Meyerozyma guilliermondii ATCC 6260]EDK39636.2 hypothetical protein PGUG_03734 [Meyerozyma guilliermondii ATCC 6260]
MRQPTLGANDNVLSMVAQKFVDLNEPLNPEAKPTLAKSSLTPEYAEASLILHGDYYRQLQGSCNRYIFWHPISMSIWVVGLVAAAAYFLRDYYAISNGLLDFFAQFVARSDMKFELIYLLPCTVLIFAFIGLSAHLLSDDLRDIADKLDQPDRIEELYGFDLRKFAKEDPNSRLSPKQKALLQNGENTHLIVYRNSPIAVITLKPLLDNSTEANYFVRITGLHVRKVFVKADFHTLLIDWALLRSRQLFHEYSKKKSDVDSCKINILVDAYSFDKTYIKFLQSRSFGRVSSSTLLDKSKKGSNLIQSLNKLLGITRDTFGVTIIAKNGDEDPLLNAIKTVPYYKSSQPNQVRKRK